MSMTIMTITPTILQDLHTKLEVYRAKRDDYAHQHDMPINLTIINPSPSKTFVRIMEQDGLDGLAEIEAWYDERIAAERNEWDMEFAYSAKVKLLEYRIFIFPNIIRAFEEEHGEFDDALFTLWYQR